MKKKNCRRRRKRPVMDYNTMWHWRCQKTSAYCRQFL